MIQVYLSEQALENAAVIDAADPSGYSFGTQKHPAGPGENPQVLPGPAEAFMAMGLRPGFP